MRVESTPGLVLGGDQHRSTSTGRSLVAHRHLGLAVRTQVRHDVAAADLGEPVGELVRERDRQGISSCVSFVA